MTRSAVTVAIQTQTSCSEVPSPDRLRAWARAALGDAGSGEITIRLVDEPESAALNERYRGRAGPTNVLAFPAGTPLPPGTDDLAPIGDIVVCAPLVVREAAERDRSVEAHWAHIVVHGCLHLAGYDHDDEADAAVMEHRERALLARFGFPDPYR